jgi:hypothetical protein
MRAPLMRFEEARPSFERSETLSGIDPVICLHAGVNVTSEDLKKPKEDFRAPDHGERRDS